MGLWECSGERNDSARTAPILLSNEGSHKTRHTLGYSTARSLNRVEPSRSSSSSEPFYDINISISPLRVRLLESALEERPSSVSCGPGEATRVPRRDVGRDLPHHFQIEQEEQTSIDKVASEFLQRDRNNG